MQSLDPGAPSPLPTLSERPLRCGVRAVIFCVGVGVVVGDSFVDVGSRDAHTRWTAGGGRQVVDTKDKRSGAVV